VWAAVSSNSFLSTNPALTDYVALKSADFEYGGADKRIHMFLGKIRDLLRENNQVGRHFVSQVRPPAATENLDLVTELFP